MDIATKVSVVLALLSGAAWLCFFLLEKELKNLSSYARLILAGIGSLLLIIAAGIFLLRPEPKTGRGPRVEVTQPIVVVPPTATSPGYFNIHYKNTGDRPATGVGSVTIASVPPSPRPFSAQEEDEIFSGLAKKFDPKKANTDDIEPGDDQKWFTAWWKSVSAKDYAENVAGRGSPIYLMLYVPYKDGENEIITEYCTFFWADNQHMCHGHNHIGPVAK